MLKLDTGQRNEQNGDTGIHSRLRFEHLTLLIEPAQAQSAQVLPPKATPTHQLLQAQTDTRQQGELVWRLGLVLCALNMVPLGVALSASNPRRASNWNLLFALLAFVVYINLLNLSQAWVASGRLGPIRALLTLHASVAVLALGLIGWRDHATSLNWKRWWRRTPEVRA